MEQKDKYQLLNRIFITTTSLLIFLHLFTRDKMTGIYDYVSYTAIVIFLIFSFLFSIYSFIKTKADLAKEQLSYYKLQITSYLVWFVVVIFLIKWP